jgi:tetratricopeptide (TPR) repeat protein
LKKTGATETNGTGIDMTLQKQCLRMACLFLFFAIISGCGSKEKSEDAEYFHQTGIDLFQEGFYDLLPKGQAAEAHAKLEQAEQAFRRAVELKPDMVESHQYLARVSALLKKYPEAADEYVRTIELEPQNVDNYLFLSSLYVRMNRFEDAEKVLAHAKTISKEPARLDQIDRLIKEIRAKAGN